jgi:hypothetical protein
VDSRAAAEYYVLFRLAQMGLLALPATTPGAELVACSERGTRVALLRVRVREEWGGFAVEHAEAERAARNRAYVFVDLPRRPGEEPACFVVPASVVAAEVLAASSGSGRLQPGGWLAAYREAWGLLGLSGAPDVRSSPVISPSSPAD